MKSREHTQCPLCSPLFCPISLITPTVAGNAAACWLIEFCLPLPCNSCSSIPGLSGYRPRRKKINSDVDLLPSILIAPPAEFWSWIMIIHFLRVCRLPRRRRIRFIFFFYFSLSLLDLLRHECHNHVPGSAIWFFRLWQWQTSVWIILVKPSEEEKNCAWSVNELSALFVSLYIFFLRPAIGSSVTQCKKHFIYL